MRTYEAWKALVDKELVRLTGYDSDGYPDYDYTKAYRQKVPPCVVAKRVLRWAMTF